MYYLGYKYGAGGGVVFPVKVECYAGCPHSIKKIQIYGRTLCRNVPFSITFVLSQQTKKSKYIARGYAEIFILILQLYSPKQTNPNIWPEAMPKFPF
jgi:hypothetical protein